MFKHLLASSLCTISILSSPSIYANRPSSEGWKLSLGAGVLSTPAFRGSKDYQLSVLPYVRVNYKDLFFASVQEGVGFNILRQDGWRAGPILRYRFSRKEDDGSSFFRVAGDTDALKGLGDVSGTIEPGGFVTYSQNNLSTEVEARKGLSGHKGYVGTFKISYKQKLNRSGPPIMLSISPRTQLVSDKYNQAYYNVSPIQSINSGLARYQASGGIFTYGIGSTLIATLSKNTSLIAFVGYDRLTGDASKSPLVSQKGSKNQLSGGAFFVYDFNLGTENYS